MSTIKANTYLDASGGNTATLNGIVPTLSIGSDQTWQTVTRVRNTWYQNTTGRPIAAYAYGSISDGIDWDVGVSTTVFVTIRMGDGDSTDSADYGWIIVPTGNYYRMSGNANWNDATELR